MDISKISGIKVRSNYILLLKIVSKRSEIRSTNFLSAGPRLKSDISRTHLSQGQSRAALPSHLAPHPGHPPESCLGQIHCGVQHRASATRARASIERRPFVVGFGVRLDACAAAHASHCAVLEHGRGEARPRPRDGRLVLSPLLRKTGVLSVERGSFVR